MSIIQPILLLLLTYYLTLRLAKFFKINQITITIIFILKTIICLFYLQIAVYQEIDAYAYFEYALGNLKFPYYKFFGTDLIYHFSYFLRTYLNFDIVSMSFLFSFFGNIGTIVFASNIKNIVKNPDKNLKYICGLIIFFPTINIWLSAIGKDAITFTCINLIIYAFLNIRSRIWILIISLILFSFIRPINGVTLFFAFIFSQIAKNNLLMVQKIFIGIISVTGLILFNTFISSNLSFIALGNFDLEKFQQAIVFYQDITMSGNNAIDLGSLPFPIKFFSFMFRPLFFDARDFYTLLLSFENLILLYIFLYPFLKLFKNMKFKKISLDSLSLFLFTFLTINWVFYALTVANLGTANRYKVMFLPALIFLSLMSSQQLNKRNLREI